MALAALAWQLASWATLLHAPTETFAEALANGTAPHGCAAEHFDRVVRLAKLFANDLKSTSKHFGGHGYIGIWSPLYNLAKVRLVYEEVCQRALSGEVHQVCEVGFNAGESALLFLEATGDAKLTSFDLGKPWTKRASDRLSRVYGDRFKLILGDSHEAVPRHIAMNPEWLCDVRDETHLRAPLLAYVMTGC